MKRVLIIAPYNRGTIGLCSLNLYEAFCQRKDCIVKCVCVHKFPNGHDGLEDCDYCIQAEAPVLLKWLNLLKQIIWFKKVKQVFKPDVTISTLGGCSTISVLSGGSDKKIGVFHSPYFQEKAKGTIVYLNTLFSYQFIYPHLDRLACVSAEVKRSILSRFPRFEKKDVQVVYNVHNTDVIFAKASEPIPPSERGVVTSDSVLYLGRLDANKAPMRTLSAFHHALPFLSKESNLLFIGNSVGLIMSDLKQYVNNNGLENRVFFLGFRANPYNYLSKVKCLVSSSYSEGLPGALIEALLLGKRIVTTNSSEGIWEILSCHEDYNPDLNGIYQCNDGFISSNLASKDKSKNSTDIDNLSKALVMCMNTDTPVEFFFKYSIQANQIVEQLLSGC